MMRLLPIYLYRIHLSLISARKETPVVYEKVHVMRTKDPNDDEYLLKVLHKRLSDRKNEKIVIHKMEPVTYLGTEN